MRILVFQHVAVEHPGIFRDFLAADGIPWDAVELDAGEPIPPFADYDALWVMGGPMDVWQEDEFPWLIPEKQAIRSWVETGKPFLGICLGHQLLADAMGGTVAAGEAPEVGVLPVTLTAAGQRDPLFDGLPVQGTCFQWHGAAVQRLPNGGVTLAESEVCPIQSIRVGARAYGLQFHVEITGGTVQEWGCIPEYAGALDDVMGEGALDRLSEDTARHLPDLNAAARILYDNFMRTAQSA